MRTIRELPVRGWAYVMVICVSLCELEMILANALLDEERSVKTHEAIWISARVLESANDKKHIAVLEATIRKMWVSAFNLPLTTLNWMSLKLMRYSDIATGVWIDVSAASFPFEFKAVESAEEAKETTDTGLGAGELILRYTSIRKSYWSWSAFKFKSETSAEIYDCEYWLRNIPDK